MSQILDIAASIRFALKPLGRHETDRAIDGL
jgi:hypothetical protein